MNATGQNNDKPFQTFLVAGQAAGCFSCFWMWGFIGPFGLVLNAIIGLILGLIHYYGFLVSLEYLHAFDRIGFYRTRVFTHIIGMGVTLGIHFFLFMPFSLNPSPSGTLLVCLVIALWWQILMDMFGYYRASKQILKKKRGIS